MKKYLLKVYDIVLRIMELFTVMYNRFISFIIKPPFVHSTDETLNEIVNKGCSVSRYGDGEFALMEGRDLLFQPSSYELSHRLKKVIVSNRENHIVCVPLIFKSLDSFTERSKKYWKKYLNRHRHKIYKMINMKKEYYDALVTRLYIDHKDKNKAKDRFKKMKELWNNRAVVMVEGTQSRLGLGNDLFDNVHSMKRIICPATNAFAKYDDILKEIKKQDPTKLILIALGPTATVLAYELSNCGYQAVDIGHIDIEYEWFLEKTVEKTPVKNKYIGEIENGTNLGDIKDVAFENEVITKIS